MQITLLIETTKKPMPPNKFTIAIEHYCSGNGPDGCYDEYHIIEIATGYVYARAYDEPVAKIICDALNNNYKKENINA